MSERNNSDIQVRIAGTVAEYAQAFRIAYEVYYPKGFAEFSEYGMRATPYQFRHGAVIFLAFTGGRPIATLSIYEGSGSDLPSASGWPVELEGIDARGLRVFELGALMALPGASSRVCLELFRAAWIYARRIRKANLFCAFVQAHHRAFYEKMFEFRQFGEAKDYSWNGLHISSVLPLVLDLDHKGPEFDERFRQYGETTRNLNWFFLRDRPQELEAGLREDLALRSGVDLDALRRAFAHLLPAETSRDCAAARVADADREPDKEEVECQFCGSAPFAAACC